MDTDEAWEQFCKDSARIEKTSISEKLDTMLAALNEIRTDASRTAQVVPSILGDNAAVETANAGAMDAGMPGMDPMGGSPAGPDAGGMPPEGPPGGESDGTGMEMAGDAMADKEELPPDMPPAGGAPGPEAGMPEMPPEAGAPAGDSAAPVQGADGLDEGYDDGDDEWTEDDDAAFNELMASLGLGGPQSAAPEAGPAGPGAPEGVEGPEEIVGGDDITTVFNDRLKDALASAVDRGDSASIASLGKLGDRIKSLLTEFDALASGGAGGEGPVPAEPPVEAVPEIDGEGAPEGEPAPEAEPSGEPPAEGPEKEPSEEKADDEEDDIKKSCDTESIEKEAGAMGAGSEGASNALFGEGAQKIDSADGMLKDPEDTLSKSVPSFSDIMKGKADPDLLLKSLDPYDGHEAIAKQYNDRAAKAVDEDAIMHPEGEVDCDIAKSAMVPDNSWLARSIMDFDFNSTSEKGPVPADEVTSAQDIGTGQKGHQDPTSIATAKPIKEVTGEEPSDEGEKKQVDMPSAQMERGEGAGQRSSVTVPVAKSAQDNGKHIMTFKEMSAIAKSGRPGVLCSVNGDITTPEYGSGSIAKSQNHTFRIGKDPMDMLLADMERYNVFKARDDF